MIKKVNVYPVLPILTIRNAIYHTALNIDLSVGDIRNCIYARAKVEEILPDGSLLVLNLKNYNKCNYVEEHISNSVVSLPEVEEDEKDTNQTELVEKECIESRSEEKETTDVELVEDLEAISPAEVTVEEEQTSEVEENLVVDNNSKKNKKNKK